LGELAAYEVSHLSVFRDAPIYAWVNVKAYTDMLARKAAAAEDSGEIDPLAQLDPVKIINAIGLGGLNSMAFTFRSSHGGSAMELFLSVPESSRQGLMKIIAGDAKDSTPPAFVPADVMKFQRWRIDGQKAWATLEKMLGDISPSWISTLNYIIDTANAGAKQSDPGFDLRANLFGNLGDDLIKYEKAPRGATVADLSSPPSVLLIGSPRPEQLAASLKGILLILSHQGGTPAEREFIGRTIYTATVPTTLFGLPEPGKPLSRTLHYAAGGSYVAITTDAVLLEEYLRSAENPPRALRDIPGLAEATEQAGGGSTGLFAFENHSESMRTLFAKLKKEAETPRRRGFSPLPGAPLVMPDMENDFEDWLDYSLLPPFEKVSKYFHYIVYTSSVTVEGLTIRMFAPVPPQLRQ
jgi:hypothetical protein